MLMERSCGGLIGPPVDPKDFPARMDIAVSRSFNIHDIGNTNDGSADEETRTPLSIRSLRHGSRDHQ
jgi:hypothetical protein